MGTIGSSYRYLDCLEVSNNYISNSRIVCVLYYGNNLANPPIPANLTITFTKTFNAFSTSYTLKVLVANVINPTTIGLNTGVKANINLFC